MEFLALIGLGIFGVMFIGGIMGIIAIGRVGRLELQVKRLQNQLLGAPDIKFTPSMRPESVPKPKPVAFKETTPEARQSKPEPVTAKTIYKPTIKQTKPVRPTKRSFEEEIGARWAVWVGGIALAFGAIFMLRYTIEAGVFSPAMRIALATLMGAVLLAAGEFLRRVDGKTFKLPDAFAGLKQTAYIPGVLTGVGIFTLLGTSYAAYELYDFIGPLVTFVLLASLSVAALALSLLHGPKMAALGLVASLVTPLLIDIGAPNYFVLYTYLLFVSVAALVLARRRDWPWLNVLTLFGALGWSFLSVEATDEGATYGAWLIFIGCMFALSTYIAYIHDKEPNGTKLKKGFRHNNIAACIWAGMAAVLMYSTAMMHVAFSVPPTSFDFLHVYIALVFAVVIMAVGWHFPRQKANIIIGGVAATLVIWLGAECEIGTVISLTMGIIIAVLITVLSFQNAKHANGKIWPYIWSGFGVVLPITIFVALHLILEGHIYKCASSISDPDCLPTSVGISPLVTAAILFIITVVAALQSWWLWKKSDKKPKVASVYAAGAAIAYTFAVLIGITALTETILLMAGILISAAIYSQIAISALRWTAAGFGLLSITHTLMFRVSHAILRPDGVIYNTPAPPKIISEQIIFNELWVYFALPTLICAGAAWLLARRYQDIWSEGLKALTLTFAAMFFVFQIRHFMNGGNILSTEFGFDEMALQVMVGLCFTLGGTLLGRRSKPNKGKRKPYELLIPGLAMTVSISTLALFALGICFVHNPLLSSFTLIKGGIVINSLILAYLLPAVALGAIMWLSRDHRPKAYIQVTGALSLVAFILYLTTSVRVLFSGSKISLWTTPFLDAELYTISAVWLMFGITLLVAGLKFKKKDIRMASALVITLTVFKAFLIDMASLEGVLRAMSFVVLGLVLIVIGRVYQKLLFSKSAAQE